MSTLHEYNINMFLDGKCNCLFITGIYGSGKTTLSNKLAIKNNAKVFHLDDIEENLKQKKYSLLPSEFKTFVEKNAYMNNIHDYSSWFLIREFCWYLMEYRKKDIYIVEGYQLIAYIRSLINYKNDRYVLPVILIEENPIIALIRKFKRECELVDASFFEKVKAFITGFYPSLKYQLECLDNYKELVNYLNFIQQRYEEYYKKE